MLKSVKLSIIMGLKLYLLLKVNQDYYFKVREGKKERVDSFLKHSLSSFSRNFIQQLIESKKVTVNTRVVKRSYSLKKGDKVRVSIPSPPLLTVPAEPIPLDIIWEDDDLLVVNKPSGMVVHPTSYRQKGTLVNALLYHTHSLSKLSGPLRRGIVHRLDKDTSGALVVAKNDLTHIALTAQFKKREVKKVYLALVRGKPSHKEGLINLRIGRSPKSGIKMVREGKLAREALTRYKTLKEWGKWSLIQLHPLTGRTHQIRVHLQSINCFLLGDRLYGGKKRREFPLPLQRAMLHSKSLGFFHPKSGEWMEFEAPLPNDMKAIIKFLENHLATDSHR